ncbi:MAG: hypothetical protein Pg6B_04540 [Candidatus Azobacteroides pseudotrichonymphae]|uniref:Uncharacterized protein n=1 Tax=Candidatus Improbicoccus pseudotrichonymphae TaxID=3033792 RepID=A0AA48KYB5_9FIRM|nr:MAG: hypothetical protein CfP315_0204 [Candidatus Improbicoccus pseudotrichonymphae]GMO34118.1 MAG: hypothetical protein Pg6B_04540 [Candidatus Azobacteroides pseudotrichonymphae]
MFNNNKINSENISSPSPCFPLASSIYTGEISYDFGNYAYSPLFHKQNIYVNDGNVCQTSIILTGDHEADYKKANEECKLNLMPADYVWHYVFMGYKNSSGEDILMPVHMEYQGIDIIVNVYKADNWQTKNFWNWHSPVLMQLVRKELRNAFTPYYDSCFQYIKSYNADPQNAGKPYQGNYMRRD